MKKVLAVIGCLIAVYAMLQLNSNFTCAALDPQRAAIHIHAWIGWGLTVFVMIALVIATIRYVWRS